MNNILKINKNIGVLAQEPFHSKHVKCPSKKKSPPCNDNEFIKKKIYKDGTYSVCCYRTKNKQYKPKNINNKNITKKNIKHRNCPSKKNPPPCSNDETEKKKYYKDGTYSVCCYKTDVSKKNPHKRKIAKTKNTENIINTEIPIIYNNTLKFCKFDNQSGICELSSKNKLDKISTNRCYFDTNERTCAFTDSYLHKKPKDIILVLQATSDYNQAFNENGDIGLFSILKTYTNLDFIYRKVSNLSEIKNIVSSFKKGTKIAHLIIMAHGLQDRMVLSNEYRITINNMKNLVNVIKPYLAINCSILLHSCLVGKGGLNGDNFAKELSINLPGHTIFGSEESIRRGDLNVIFAYANINKRILEMWYEIEPDRNYQLYPFYTSIKNN